MDMRRLERGGGAGQQSQENMMEVRLREWKSGKEQGVPRAAQSMMQIPQSPIYADDDEPMQPPPKGSLPKESASYSYGTGAADHADAGTSLVDPAQAQAEAGGAAPNRQAARGLVGALGTNRGSASYKAMAMQSYTSMKQADREKEKVEEKKARVAAKATAKAAAKHAQYDVGLSDEDEDEASPGSKSSARSRGARSGKSSPSFSRGSRHGSPSAASIKSATAAAGTLSGRSGMLSPAKSKSSFSRDSGSPSYRRQPGVVSPHSSRDGLQSPASRRSSLLSSPTGSPKAKGGRLNPSERKLAEQRISIPGEPEHRDFSDSDSDVGPTTSESSEEEMGAAERIDMMERANGTPSRALVPRSRSPDKAPSSAPRAKGKIQASLYVAAKQPPWVEAALAEKKAMEDGDDYSDSSEDERDRTREGKAGTKVCRKACGSCVKECCKFTSEPDTVERENPPHREWERAEKALSAEQEDITKRWRNCWGRCSPKRLTLVAQLRLCMLGGCGLSCFCCAFTASTRTSSKPRQLLPQVIGCALILANAFGCGWVVDQTGTRLFGERNYMLGIFSVLCMLSLQFMCEHHREVHHGQLLCRFEGRTWQVLNVK